MPSIPRCSNRNPPPPCPKHIPHETLLSDGKTKCCYKSKTVHKPIPARPRPPPAAAARPVPPPPAAAAAAAARPGPGPPPGRKPSMNANTPAVTVQKVKYGIDRIYAKTNKAEFVFHDKNSDFNKKNIGVKDWNNMEFTQLVQKTITIPDNIWSLRHPFDPYENLYDMSPYEIKGSKTKDLVMFHGTSANCADSLCNKIEWTYGKGALGNGFYLTFNPNEAKAYACQACHLYKINTAIVLEIVIKEGHNLNGWRWNGNLDFPGNQGIKMVRNSSMPNQIVVRQDVINKIEIKRVHFMKIDEFSDNNLNGLGPLKKCHTGNLYPTDAKSKLIDDKLYEKHETATKLQDKLNKLLKKKRSRKKISTK